MDTKKLRQKILDLAIRGKLVPQDPNDEPASVLLERIRAEKERLIKEGKIKQSKKSAKSSDTPHYENRKVGEANEVPFEVPESWKWSNVESFTYDLQYGTSEKSSNEGDVPVLRMGNISRIGTIDFTDLVYSSNKDDIIKYALLKDDLLFNRTNSSEWVGKTAIFKSDSPAIYAGYLIRVRCILVCPDYINFVLNSSYHREWCNSIKTDAVNQSNINAQKLSKHLIPIPPYEEQLRIVAETKKWMSVIDKMEGDVSELDQVINTIKSKILDLAIHGKLVPQDLNDEPAIELLKRINPKFTPCDNAHYPFEIPTTWCLTYVKNIVDNPSCKPFQILQSDINYIGQTPVVSQSSNYIEGYSDRKDCVFKNKNAVLIFGDHTRNLKYVDFDFIVGADGVKIVIPHISVKYSYYALQFIINGMRNRGYARHYSVLTNSTIPVPPLSEQLRIVAKIEELFAVLDEIQKSIEA